MSIVAVRSVAAAAFAVLCATSLASEAKAQSTPTQSTRHRREALPQLARFCPSWAEAHERTLASLNNGRPVYPVHWKGCIWLKEGELVEVVDSDDSSTEIIYKGKHWFADDPLF
jgi:hypothetical protein